MISVDGIRQVDTAQCRAFALFDMEIRNGGVDLDHGTERGSSCVKALRIKDMTNGPPTTINSYGGP